MNKKIEYSKEELMQLYDSCGSIEKVAEFINRAYSTVNRWFNVYKINRGRRQITISKEHLVGLYKKNKSIGKVAAELSKSYSTVRYWFKKYEIETQESCMTVYQEIRNIPMSVLQKSIVLGSLLGDGTLRLASHSKNAYLKISHCEKQQGYLFWKKKLLDPFSRPVILSQKAKHKIIDGRPAYSTDLYEFRTIVHPDITHYYRQYYLGKHKHILDSSVVDSLDLMALSIWFADDGSVYVDKRNGTVSCSIATNSFNYEEQVILKNAVSKFFQGTISISKQSGKDRDDMLLRMFGTKKLIDFLFMISSILPDCIHYKLGLQRLGVKPPNLG